MLDRSFALGLEIGAWAASGEDSSRLGLCFNEERERINAGARALFLSTAAEEHIEALSPLHRIAPQRDRNACHAGDFREFELRTTHA